MRRAAMLERLAELVALDVLSAGDAIECREVLAKWHLSAGKVGQPHVMEWMLPHVLRHLTGMLHAETEQRECRRILSAIGHVQDRLTR